MSSLEELNRLPRTRKEALSQGSKFYFNGEGCSKGHVSPFYTASYNCVECRHEAEKKRPPRKHDPNYGKKYRESEAGRATLAAYESTELRKRSRKNTLLKFQYGITLNEYEKMFRDQLGLCDVCSDKMDSSTRRLCPCVDHNHETGKIRGLLCGACNKGISHLKESPQILQQAIRYIRRHASHNT